MFNHEFFAESRRPVPTWLLNGTVVAAGLLPVILSMKSDNFNLMSAIVALVIGAAAFYGWLASPTDMRVDAKGNSRLWVGLGLGAALSGFIAAWAFNEHQRLHALWPLLPFLLQLAYHFFGRRSITLRHIIVPLMFGSGIMLTSAVVAHAEIGAFPAAIAVLFVSVLRFTLDIENDVFENHAEHGALEVHHHYRARLAIAAIVFFLFGTVSLWPWLGTLYGQGYFWLLLCGVLLPLVFFWGRIRQPKTEGARTALIRFNRVAPVLGLIHMLAIAIG